MTFLAIRPLRLRLVAMAAAVLAPMVVIIGLNAAYTYKSVRQGMEQIIADAAWAKRQAVISSLFSAARYATAVGEAQRVGGAATDFLVSTLALNPGYLAVRIRLEDGLHQAIAQAAAPRRASIERAFDAPAHGAPDLELQETGAKIWFRPVTLEKLRGVMVKTTFGEHEAAVEAWVLVDEDLVRRVFDSHDVGGSEAAHFSIVTADGEGFASATDPADAGGDDWLPAHRLAPGGPRLAVLSASRDGHERLFAVAPLTNDGAAVLAAMSSSSSRAIAWRLVISFIVPILTIVILSLAYLRTMKTGVIDWVEGLDRVARISAGGGVARAVVSQSAPIEFENVARSLNQMLDAREAREAELSEALNYTRYLTRELHHRIKNSLQLVQSYLALGAREAHPQSRDALLAAQCRAYILSSAYRRALAEGEMRPFEIDPFLTDVATYAGEAIRRPAQKVGFVFRTGDVGDIDQAIPLGMIVVELIEMMARRPNVERLTVTGERDAAPDHIVIVASLVGAAEACKAPLQPSKLLQGLFRQIGASIAPTPEGAWFAVSAPRPTPQIYSPRTFV